MNPRQLRDELVHGEAEALRRRREVIGLSLAGMAAVTPVVMLQTGLVRHLPDPPLPGFHSDEANLSETAYKLGVPDGTLALASLGINLVLAAWGGRDRARRRPWLPLLAAGKAVADAAGATLYFWQMLSGKEPWCAYCVTGAAANFGVLRATLPEAREAWGVLARGTRPRPREISPGVRVRGRRETMASHA